MTSCCPPGSLGFLASDSLGKGDIVIENGFEMYVSGESSTRGILFIPDVFGWNGGRIRAIADHYSSLGYVSVVPKLLVPCLDGGTDGDGLAPDFSFASGRFVPYISTITWPEVVKPRVQAALSYLKSKGVTKVATVGFCWGGWVVCHAFTDPDTANFFSVGCIPHPSVTLETMAYQADAAALAAKVTKPILFLPAGNDPDTYRPGGEIYEAVKANNPATETDLSFESMTHGWSVRGDTSDPLVKEQVIRVFDAVTAYIERVMI